MPSANPNGQFVDLDRRAFLQRLTWTGALALGSLNGCGGATRNPAPPKATGRRKKHSFEPAYLGLERTGELKRREEKLWSFLSKCRLCARKCEVNRVAGQKGRCSSDARLKVASIQSHFGEERPLVGRGGSGTIFFSNCNLLCCFCQNWEINHRGDGRYATHSQLADMMITLQKRGCHNINLVTPTHLAPHLVRALRIAIRRGLNLPLVYNTGGYDNLEVIRLLDSVVDIYLPDFKYMERKMAHRYSAGAVDYPQVAAAAIKEMHRQTGLLKTNRKGIATRGLIIRHLVMPNNVAGTDRFVKWVARELSPDTYVNIMGQYHPAHRAHDYPQIARRITGQELIRALRWARQAGLRRLAS